MSYLDDLEREAMVCEACEDIIKDDDEYEKIEDPETFDDVYYHKGCVPEGSK